MELDNLNEEKFYYSKKYQIVSWIMLGIVPIFLGICIFWGVFWVHHNTIMRLLSSLNALLDFENIEIILLGIGVPLICILSGILGAVHLLIGSGKPDIIVSSKGIKFRHNMLWLWDDIKLINHSKNRSLSFDLRRWPGGVSRNMLTCGLFEQEDWSRLIKAIRKYHPIKDV